METTARPMITLDGVGKRYPDGTVAVADLSFAVATGELMCLVGPSGCGKTTVIRMINRLVEPTSGRITVDGEDVVRSDPVRLRRRIGYVIQQVGLFPHQTVFANVATVPRLLGWSRSRTRERVRALLELVGLDPGTVSVRYPRELSGGQQQRVGVARALAADPPVLLMDEPFSAIDPIARDRLQVEFLRLQREIRKTVVFVTHDLAEAVRLGDRVAVLGQGGRLEQLDTPAQVLGAPASPFVADFTGADRMLLRLSVTPLRRADLTDPADPAEWANALAGVEVGASLREALAVMLATGDGRVEVRERGTPVGVLTPSTLHAALRRSLAADQENG
ncbi:glycine betaine ABC transporter ATP binding subunit YehX [Frankia sp. Hr75.2]|nr:ATP-binding cassette domain-containing protein [Parafrankia soli]TCJ35288.1 ATP-binding cassette domain-containing protein [Parafrankia sp. BMG5.11]CAI7980484.1 glycine betaine ABC transporter ATP binding subunit YehX [Frankia sp. Hr75.2]SQE00820.1 Carnitine/betaine transport ATP-binding protein OpuCA [Parafrankia sp. Ea1.12]